MLWKSQHVGQLAKLSMNLGQECTFTIATDAARFSFCLSPKVLAQPMELGLTFQDSLDMV